MQSKYITSLLQQIKLNANGRMISVAESCTGGLLASYLTQEVGSSNFFTGGVISYSNESKVKLLNVSISNLSTYGAVSEEVAREMASGCQDQFNSDISISITGIAGPDSDISSKPVGMVCFAVNNCKIVQSFTKYFKGNRLQVRQQSCVFALELIIDNLI
ncbi:MAG: hypothetical protein DGJ47_000241 [Rickettsiaceae bacterium]